MKKIFILLLLFATLPLFSQDESQSSDTEMAKAADDMRYDNAYQFYRLNEFKKAQILFLEYLEIYTDGIHREEAFDNLASIYFAKYDYRKALKYYLQHFEEYSDTEEGVRAYYNAGICLAKMGKKKEAEEIYQRIIQEYPSYQAANSARMQLDVQDILK